ncbi:MAG: TIR domain-containing protein [Defluviitaleaceae bacterium]|nr:TIR domain-containing protein [Defluviitaleaceae bacterium]
MARKVFYSFHYKPDAWRTSQVRNIGKIEGNKPASDNDWETITKGSDEAIKKWINDQLNGRSCTIVLIGSETAGRKWIKYEIEKSWNDGKGVLGIYIHNLKDSNGNKSTKGKNPFTDFTIKDNSLSTIVKAYDPPYSDSKEVYNYISENIENWIEEAITIRGKY